MTALLNANDINNEDVVGFVFGRGRKRRLVLKYILELRLKGNKVLKRKPGFIIKESELLSYPYKTMLHVLFTVNTSSVSFEYKLLTTTSFHV